MKRQRLLRHKMIVNTSKVEKSASLLLNKYYISRRKCSPFLQTEQGHPFLCDKYR